MLKSPLTSVQKGINGLGFRHVNILIFYLYPKLFHYFNFQIYLYLRFGPDTMVSLLTKIVATIERVRSFSQRSQLKVTPWYLDRTEDRITIHTY